MLAKWIVCRVLESQKELFSDAQKQWEQLKHIEGFVAQFGGWNSSDDEEACILALWDSKKAYERFMGHDHDRIFNASDQRQTYLKISVNLYELQSENKINSLIKVNNEIIVGLFQSNSISSSSDFSKLDEDLVVCKKVSTINDYLMVMSAEKHIPSHNMYVKHIRLEPEWTVIHV